MYCMLPPTVTYTTCQSTLQLQCSPVHLRLARYQHTSHCHPMSLRISAWSSRPLHRHSRKYNIHRTISNAFKQSIVILTATLRTLYTNLMLLVMGDFQYTVSDTTLHRMGQKQPPPTANVLTQCLQHPFNLVSVIPTQHLTLTYHTW